MIDHPHKRVAICMSLCAIVALALHSSCDRPPPTDAPHSSQPTDPGATSTTSASTSEPDAARASNQPTGHPDARPDPDSRAEPNEHQRAIGIENLGDRKNAQRELTVDQIEAVAKSVDFDEDGFSNHDDNCPAQKNPDQKDGDGDGFGDICDRCPDQAHDKSVSIDGCAMEKP
jgi:hypothetical protein